MPTERRNFLRAMGTAGLIGLALPGQARLLFQYDVIRNELGHTATGFPTDLRDDTWTLRLHGNL